MASQAERAANTTTTSLGALGWNMATRADHSAPARDRCLVCVKCWWTVGLTAPGDSVGGTGCAQRSQIPDVLDVIQDRLARPIDSARARPRRAATAPLFGSSRRVVEGRKAMYCRRVRARLRYANSRRRVASPAGAWPLLVLNCPECGQHLALRDAGDTHVYMCSHHGDWFAAAEDGRLYDVRTWRPRRSRISPGRWGVRASKSRGLQTRADEPLGKKATS